MISTLRLFAQKGKWQNYIYKILSNDLFWLLLTCGIFRYIFYLFFSVTHDYPDSQTYLGYNANILLGQVEDYRTPVYPYFIRLIKLFGTTNLLQNVVLAQSIISFLTIIVFYKTLKNILKKRAVILIAALIYGILPSTLNFDKCILTESFSISALVVFLYFVVSYLKQPAIYKAVLFTFYIFFLIMLRPAFIFLLPVIILFWIIRMMIRKTEWKMSLSGLAASAVCILLIIGYSHLNYTCNEVNNISVVSTVNQLDILIDYNIYTDKSDTELSDYITTNIHKENREDLSDSIFTLFDPGRIAKYNKNCTLHHFPVYLQKSLEKILKTGTSSTSVIYAEFRKGVSGRWIEVISNILSLKFWFLYLLLVFDFIYIIYLWIKSKEIPWLKICIWTIITAQFMTALLGAPNESERLFVSALPYLIVLLSGYADKLVCHIKGRSLSR
ncbi:MAG: glycosyltransferase family 39 protein [Bacteroidota bacterium]|nr:glycosyltransferase family 39 protein [Bacteroidota bacterium]